MQTEGIVITIVPLHSTNCRVSHSGLISLNFNLPKGEGECYIISGDVDFCVSICLCGTCFAQNSDHDFRNSNILDANKNCGIIFFLLYSFNWKLQHTDFIVLRYWPKVLSHPIVFPIYNFKPDLRHISLMFCYIIETIHVDILQKRNKFNDKTSISENTVNIS